MNAKVHARRRVGATRDQVVGLGIALAAEALGTAALVAIGLSFVILEFGRGSPLATLGSAAVRRVVTGFLFGSTGAVIALSPVGKHSGAHINPIVTLAFVMTRTMRAWHGLAYAVAQFAGAVLGAVPLLAWSAMGRSVDFGSTTPGPGYGTGIALAGEIATTFAMIVLLISFLRHEKWRPFTPAIFPPLYALMVLIEAPISGTSTNPARSFGPALISGEWRGFWIYCVGPVVGTMVAIGLLRLPVLHRAEVLVAKLYHFHHDPHGLFHWKESRRA